MTVRFYFSWRSASVIPTAATWWNSTNSGITGTLVRVPEGIRNRQDMVQVKSVATNPYNMLAGSFITEPLTAGIIADGTPFRLSTSAYMTGTSADAIISATIRHLDSAGNQKGVLFAGPTNTTSATSGNVANRKLSTTTSGTTRRLEGNLSAAVLVAGDRIEVAIGVRWVTAVTSVNFFWKPTANERAVGDLPLVNDYTLPADYALSTSLRDWIEFGNDTSLTGAEVTLSEGEVQFGDRLNDFTLNKGSTLPFIDLERIDGIDSSAVQLSTATSQGAHGGYVTSEFEGPRTITLEGILYSTPSTVNSNLQKLKRNFAPSILPQPLYIGLESSTYMYWGKSQGLRYVIDRTRSYGVVRFQVQIVCADPRRYGKMYVKPLTSPGWNSIVVDGDRPTPALISVTNTGSGTSSNLDVQLDNVNGTFYARLPTLAATEELIIDTGKRTAIVNGLINRRNVLTFQTASVAARWLDLEPGGNNIALSISSGSAVSGYVRYRPAWW
jgi:hypothetical protein